MSMFGDKFLMEIFSKFMKQMNCDEGRNVLMSQNEMNFEPKASC